MCEDCDEVQPLYVAYFRKAGGSLWRPPQPALAPRDRLRCDAAAVRERDLLKRQDIPERKSC
jgi:hypothetical protein